MNNEKQLDLLNELIVQANGLYYGDGKRDAVQKRAEMLFRKFFGENSHYIEKLKSIRYSPVIVSSSSPKHVYESAFNSGKKQLINLLKVSLEDMQLDNILQPNNSKSGDIINSNKVFIIHGHNEEMKQSVARTLEKLNLEPVILHEQPNKGKTVIEKFTDNSEVLFAIALLSADDIAYKKADVVENAKFRARQNVIFELGYFIGKIGRERVLALHEEVPNLEIPSDYNGVLFVSYDPVGKWKFDLVRELKELGVNVDANKII